MEFAKPDLSMPAVPKVRAAEVGDAVDAIRAMMPPPERMATYAGLGLLAAFSVIEWPVAAAIGVATAISQRGARQEARAVSRARRSAA